ncbi:KinB-signaling pathway activation protein [Brevibacillus reuszeri]|uniref:KinB-signaling pathway activation protein n=1 Tax=Brevibacillus reuszeri TaxID=54915 RepID=A0A0K9YKE5_9BACL|nr:KinB-signaling pathway activation protein [Brevibacillus reuszeri]KNB69134.1 membrane protein [Brevibacillus reuszeri]MED1859692.1 KinB-signaling pathway activation protein [Brevibacillus reuszeri]GED72444.1 KinB-signaling pathway activation protein [Brevibacillus reuszeri]
MSLRKYGWLFITTLLLGGLGGVLVALIFDLSKLLEGSIGNFFVGTLMYLLYGMTISIVAQMGFFAYMTINYFAKTIFKTPSMWRSVQVFLIIFVFFDMIYLRYTSLGEGGSIGPYFIEPIILLIVAVVTAYGKTSLTNRTAWVPTLFFMYVVTALEWIPALKENDVHATLSMLVPLLFCNVWQVMQLHRLVKRES